MLFPGSSAALGLVDELGFDGGVGSHGRVTRRVERRVFVFSCSLVEEPRRVGCVLKNYSRLTINTNSTVARVVRVQSINGRQAKLLHKHSEQR